MNYGKSPPTRGRALVAGEHVYTAEDGETVIVFVLALDDYGVQDLCDDV